MKVLVLGSAAGVGYPRRACAARSISTTDGPARTRSALAVSPDGCCWVLVNASPDIGEQLRRHEALHAAPGGGGAASIRAVVLTSASIDAAAGLLSLRDGPPLDLYATPAVFEDLTSGLPLLSVLQHYCGVRWHLIGVCGEQRSCAFRIDGAGSLEFEAIAMPGLAPPYSTHRNDPAPGHHIALGVFDPATRRRVVYAPGLACAPHDAIDPLHDADCLFIDGSVCNAGGSAAAPPLPELLAHSRATRKVLLHLPAGDPLLDAGSRERHRLQAHGFEIGFDGMEIEL